jgi:hypothetical protein
MNMKKMIINILLSLSISLISIFNIFFSNNKYAILSTLFLLLFLFFIGNFLILSDINDIKKEMEKIK